MTSPTYLGGSTPSRLDTEWVLLQKIAGALASLASSAGGSIPSMISRLNQIETSYVEYFSTLALLKVSTPPATHNHEVIVENENVGATQLMTWQYNSVAAADEITVFTVSGYATGRYILEYTF